jgi:hypothetical protein
MKNHILQKEWEEIIVNKTKVNNWWSQKIADYEKQNIKVLQVTGQGQAFQRMQVKRSSEEYSYLLHVNLLLKQDDHIYVEEQVVPLKMEWDGDNIVGHELIEQLEEDSNYKGEYKPELDGDATSRDRSFVYDRRKAVQYAERWWNEYNPAYQKFENDCTNFISQCLRAGGAPMWGEPNRSRGWWYSGSNWSYSWSVANAIRWYLSSSTKGLVAKEVERAEDLMLGDVICYDFEGDGKWNHNTIVVAKDANGDPYVNAHSFNSRQRYWKYEDSTAWTPRCQYKFFRIGG